ncbi:MAG: three-Cys-motif partner protein TcmP [Candidatus Gastranaerophilaceae bacterium]
MTLEQKHFETKYPHTEIKHKLLSTTLNSTIYVANHFTEEFLSKEFVLIDLFAGKGMFEDGTKGSPMIALDIINNYFKIAISKNFNKFTLIFIEKNIENYASLIDNISKKILQEDCPLKIKIIIASNEWESYSKVIQNYLSKTSAAFIFVDPFSTELNMKKLKPLINPDKYHTILTLINISGLERILGLNSTKCTKKVCEYFDVDLKTIERLKKRKNITNAGIIRNLIKISLKNIEKDFIINLGLPRTSKGKLENADRFYLCLLTNSVGISDTFLRTYGQILGIKEKTKSKTEQKQFSLASKILKFINKKKIVSLLQITSELYDDFYSWKEASEKEIPTSSNLTKAVNSLIENGKIKLKTTEFTCKRNSNKLLAKTFSSKIKQETVIVEKVPLK